MEPPLLVSRKAYKDYYRKETTVMNTTSWLKSNVKTNGIQHFECVISMLGFTPADVEFYAYSRDLGNKNRFSDSRYSPG